MSPGPTFLTLSARDPLIARDGRPFELGLRMKSLDWFYPSVVAGSLRTMLGNLASGFPAAADEYSRVTDALKQIAIGGPFPCVNGEIYFPGPQDVVFREKDGVLDAFGMRPVGLKARGDGGGSDLPPGLEPALLPRNIEEDFKAVKSPAFWSCAEIIRWILNASGRDFFPKSTTTWPASFLHAPAKDVRTHVQMDPETGAGKSGALFQSIGLDLFQFIRGDGHGTPGISKDALSIRVVSEGEHGDRLRGLDRLHPLGGERRLVRWEAGNEPAGWTCPDEVRRHLQAIEDRPRKRVRMVLATPALFRMGWRPGWLHEQAEGGRIRLTGTVPGTDVIVRLISACIDRWRPISGWSYERGSVGAKPIRRLVPAGGVYFFEVMDGKPGQLAARWLESVCDESILGDHQYIGDGAQNRRDGFGLALWGVWEPADPASTFDT